MLQLKYILWILFISFLGLDQVNCTMKFENTNRSKTLNRLQYTRFLEKTNDETENENYNPVQTEEHFNSTKADVRLVELIVPDNTSERNLFIQLNVTFTKQAVPSNVSDEVIQNFDYNAKSNHSVHDNDTYHLCKSLNDQFTCYSISVVNLKPQVRKSLQKIFKAKQYKIPYLCDLTSRGIFEQSNYCKKLKQYKKTYLKLKYQSLIPTDLFEKNNENGLFYFCEFDTNNFDANICWPVNNSRNDEESKQIIYSIPILDNRKMRSNFSLLCYVAKESNTTLITCWPAQHITNDSQIFPNNQTYICNVLFKNDSVKLTKCWLNSENTTTGADLAVRNDSFFCQYKTDGSLLSEFVCRLRKTLESSKTNHESAQTERLKRSTNDYEDSAMDIEKFGERVVRIRFNNTGSIDGTPPRLLMTLTLEGNNSSSDNRKPCIVKQRTNGSPKLDRIQKLQQELNNLSESDSLETLIRKVNFSDTTEWKNLFQNILEHVNIELNDDEIEFDVLKDLNATSSLMPTKSIIYNTPDEIRGPDNATSIYLPVNTLGNMDNLPTINFSLPEQRFDKILFRFIVNHPTPTECPPPTQRVHEEVDRSKLFSFIPFTHIVHHQVVQVPPESAKEQILERKPIFNSTASPPISEICSENLFGQTASKIPNTWFNLMKHIYQYPNSSEIA